MSQKLHKDLSTLLDFFLKQRSNPSEQMTHRPKLINKPGFFGLKDLQHHLNNPLIKPEYTSRPMAKQFQATHRCMKK